MPAIAQNTTREVVVGAIPAGLLKIFEHSGVLYALTTTTQGAHGVYLYSSSDGGDTWTFRGYDDGYLCWALRVSDSQVTVLMADDFTPQHIYFRDITLVASPAFGAAYGRTGSPLLSALEPLGIQAAFGTISFVQAGALFRVFYSIYPAYVYYWIDFNGTTWGSPTALATLSDPQMTIQPYVDGSYLYLVIGVGLAVVTVFRVLLATMATLWSETIDVRPSPDSLSVIVNGSWLTGDRIALLVVDDRPWPSFSLSMIVLSHLTSAAPTVLRGATFATRQMGHPISLAYDPHTGSWIVPFPVTAPLAPVAPNEFFVDIEVYVSQDSMAQTGWQYFKLTSFANPSTVDPSIPYFGKVFGSMRDDGKLDLHGELIFITSGEVARPAYLGYITLGGGWTLSEA